MITQEGRWLQIESPLGKDTLILTGVDGEEGLSWPFSFNLKVLSRRGDLSARDVLGKSFSISLHRHDKERRLFHGLARSLSAGVMAERGYRVYDIDIVPWLWYLTLKTDCRIFEQQSVRDIIPAVFLAAGFADFDDSGIKGDHAVREYCVQYRETDFDFVSRLMQEEGIFYYFRHEAGRHIMVLGDHISAYRMCDEQSVVYSDAPHTQNVVSEWRNEHDFCSGRVGRRDYDFKAAAYVAAGSASILGLSEINKYELYDYPGGAESKGTLDALTRVRMEDEETHHQVVFGHGSYTSFGPGAKFKMEKHPYKEELGKGWVLTTVRHHAVDESHVMAGSPVVYNNTFQCIPDSTLYRPSRITPKAIVRGPQTAVVVGPEGEDIYCDEFGRIRVRFHWDRKDMQSCWARVAQSWAGKGWGALFIPRMGMEVVVEFLEGDPDRPLVVGAVYNGKNPVPYALPANKSQSGIKTRSTKFGGEANFNELRFEDKMGEEEVYFHAEKDFRRVVEHNDSLKVGHDQTIAIRRHRTEIVETGNETVEICEGDRSVTVSNGDDTHTVSTGNRSAVVSCGDESLTVSKGKRTVTVSKGDDEWIVSKGDQSTKISHGKMTVEAMKSIELKVGQNNIMIDQSGISINGLMIKIHGDAMIEAKAPMTTVSGDGMVTVKGGIVMVN